ncbi:serine/threonine protein phosphatase [Saccharothrix sp. NRRL B-16348]|uniref:serine/threonine protein phosphatase n=1 Tax=Saccharothrix sp. NRRL B-16348 TaxID=1415542 RepID=UPI0018D05A1C|nr:serine/threonine protein phosphatase [Saccharothrix sp. NRRL B-16348]
MITSRRARHERLSVLLSSRDDRELERLVDANGSVGVGGGSAVVDVDGTPVFVKRVPLTDRELARPHSTANLFDLPVCCQYGIGGPSFNAWRELAANRIVTDAVLAGETAAFPLLHHWRVLPGRAPVAAEHAAVDEVVALMGGSPAVRVRLDALAAASHSLVLFSEYVPRPVEGWLGEDPASKAEAVERQFAETVAFLRDRDLLHMDGHLGNMRTDGERIYLTDFGLVTSPAFELSAAERDFVRRNATHDAGYAAMRLVNWLVTDVCGVTVPPGGVPTARNDFVRRCAAGEIPDDVPSAVAGVLARHAPAAARLNAFYWRLFGGEVHAEYPDAHGERIPRR